MGQLISKIGKLFGGLLLLSGSTVSTALLVSIATSHAAGVVLSILSFLLIVFGIAPAMLGSLVLYFSFKAERRAIRDRFFQLVLANKGRLSLLHFAAASRLEPAIARQYLDGWAKEFDANFEVSDSGDIYYIFAIESLALPENTTVQAVGQTLRQWMHSM
jgi:hypothetical protein